MNRLLLAQGVYYLVTGLWALVSLSTFELVTGPKVDDWLVQTVGALLLAIGASLVIGARRAKPAPETLVLAGGTALAFIAIELTFVLNGRISPIYLADTAVELVFLGGALWAGLRSFRSATGTGR